MLQTRKLSHPVEQFTARDQTTSVTVYPTILGRSSCQSHHWYPAPPLQCFRVSSWTPLRSLRLLGQTPEIQRLHANFAGWRCLPPPMECPGTQPDRGCISEMDLINGMVSQRGQPERQTQRGTAGLSQPPLPLIFSSYLYKTHSPRKAPNLVKEDY